MLQNKIIYAWFMLAFVTPMIAPIQSAQAARSANAAAKRQQQRNEYTKFNTIIDALDVTAGMTILDVGANAGSASFLFAEKLRGSGEVFATDISENFVKYVADETKKRGITNLYSVLVNKNGLDDFYSKHRYDIVFLSNVYHCLDDRIEYFSKLRGYLKPNGRLVLILYNQAPLFSEDELIDVDNLAESLSKETDDNPFVKRLSSTSKQLLKDKGKTGPASKALKSALIDDFNLILIDPQFYRHFYITPYFKRDLFTASERVFVNLLLMSLKEDGSLEVPASQLDPKALRSVIRLNRLIFDKYYANFLAHDHNGFGAYFPADDAARQTSKYVVLRELDAAGYKFAQEIKLSVYFDAVIMVPKKP